LHWKEAGTDVTVTRAADCRNDWTLADLLGRPMGRIVKARGPGFTIHPAKRAQRIMGSSWVISQASNAPVLIIRNYGTRLEVFVKCLGTP